MKLASKQFYSLASKKHSSIEESHQPRAIFSSAYISLIILDINSVRPIYAWRRGGRQGGNHKNKNHIFIHSLHCPEDELKNIIKKQLCQDILLQFCLLICPLICPWCFHSYQRSSHMLLQRSCPMQSQCNFHKGAYVIQNYIALPQHFKTVFEQKPKITGTKFCLRGAFYKRTSSKFSL